MRFLKLLGLGVFFIGLSIFTAAFFLSEHTLENKYFEAIAVIEEANDDGTIDQKNVYWIANGFHREAIRQTAQETGILGQTYHSNITFMSGMAELMQKADTRLAQNWDNEATRPTDVDEWTYKMGDYWQGEYAATLTKATTSGVISENSILFLLLSLILGSFGAVLYFLADVGTPAGIKHNGIYHSSAMRGVDWRVRTALLVFILGLVLMYLWGQALWLFVAFSFVLISTINYTIWKEKNYKKQPPRSASPSKGNGWLGILVGVYLIAFYVFLYWYPQYMTNWTALVSPISRAINGGDANQWFLYGFLYCLVMLVMGIRMLMKYRHNRYQLIRTTSVVFFQIGFAFLLPELLAQLNAPAMDLKYAWPLDYDMFYYEEINKTLEFGNVGLGFFIWGIVLSLVIIPLFTYIYGKRWYCSWVCGCGGLAETLGDPYRQLSDKSVRAWRIERYLIHAVLVVVVIMTGAVLYHYLTGNETILFLDAKKTKEWYGFVIGSVFSGIVGTGFYPLMGNRVWCRFGCPLAALMGIVQKFKSRFRITTNGGQCISCGNCSTYCEMGIDVRHYAQRGQDIVRASCVGCGVCSAVCPRGVLRLENGTADISDRTTELRTLHISKEDGVSIRHLVD